MAAIIELQDHRDRRHRLVGVPSRPRRFGGPSSVARPTRAAVGGALVVLAVVVALVAAGASLVTSPTASSAVTSSGELHRVAPGETMWSIAEQYLPEVRRSDAVASLEALNAGRTSLVPGDVVAIPLVRE